MSKAPYIIAHRGLSVSYPENTMSAFRAAVDLGVDWIGLDVVMTGGDVLIVSHDTMADRRTDGTGSFKTMSFEQIKTLDARIRFEKRLAGERIPTLDGVITLVEPPPPIRLCIEIKGNTSGEFMVSARATVTLLQGRDFLRNASIASFDPECLRAVRGWEPLLSTNLDPMPQNGT